VRVGTPSTAGFGEQLPNPRVRAGLSEEALSHAAWVSVRALAADMERGRTSAVSSRRRPKRWDSTTPRP
jgi:hypothetical protein